MIGKKILSQWVSFLIFVTIAILLLHKKGYAISLGLLAVTALVYFFHDLIATQSFTVSKATITQDYGKIISTFLLFVSSAIFFYFYHHEAASYLDKPLKLILFTLILLLLLRYPIKLNALLLALGFAGIIAGYIAIYEVYYLEKRRAFKIMISIQGGDIAMGIGLLNTLACFYLAKIKANKMLIFCFFAAALGIMASFLSGARGAWVCLPIVLLFFLYAYRHRLSVKNISIGVTVLSFMLIFFALNPKITDRIYKIHSEVTSYYDGTKKKTSIGYRFELWKSSILSWQEKPLLGWGEQNISIARKQQAQAKKVIPYLEKSKLHAHNQYLEELSIRGTLGFSVFMVFLLIPFLAFSKYRNHMNYRVRLLSHLGMLHIFLISTYCLTQVFFAHNSGMVFYALMIVVFYSTLHQNLQQSSQEAP